MLIRVNVDQFFGIEYEEFPAQIAQVAMWLVDHQMNLLVSEAFGMYFARIPLKSSANIVHGNALKIPWGNVVAQERLSYILGNPPFVGSKYQKPEQRAEIAEVSGKVKSCGILDYVTGWYFLAAQYIQGTGIECAFVSTNSIAQGEQVGVLWKKLAAENITINFAHRTFQWNSEARGKAAVHCVIIGFSVSSRKNKKIYEYDDIRSEPHEVTASNINAYLVDGPSVVLENRRKPLCGVAIMLKGSQPTDGGNLILSGKERQALVEESPEIKPFVRLFIGAKEFINGLERWCLWLEDAPPALLKQSKPLLQRIEGVRQMRLDSKKAATRKWADYPTLFTENRQSKSDYLIVPSVSSEKRKYVPIGFMPPEVIASNLCITLPDATRYHFGILSSTMHMAWMRYTAGRLKSDYRYSIGLVYNNYPWPLNATDKQKAKVEQAAQAVFDARAAFPDSTLADLYDPLTMPAALTKAHAALDRAVDKCYRPQAFTNELNRMQFLFALYEELTAQNS
ncbi:MAG: class I SAM-dependent DNA methyltransferase [Candidatus Electrothrix sp. AR4]|nr:class I SAM-dependent DNA methyltransferase [Candidatus Electrothrix sp. AR4]